MKKNAAKIFLLLLSVPFLFGCAAKKVARPSSYPASVSYRLAVLPFESSNPFVPGTTMSDYFTIQILQTVKGVDVIERKDLVKVLQEQKLTLTGMIKPEKFSKLGSILGVDAVIVGSVQTLETIQGVSGSIAVTVKLVEVSTGKILWADKQKISHATWSVREVPEIAEIIMEKTAKKMVRKIEKSMASRSIAFSNLAQQFPDNREVKLVSSGF